MAHCGSFWTTLELLVSIAGKNELNSPQFNEEIEDWLNNFRTKDKYHYLFSSRQDENKEENEKETPPIDYHLIECNITHPVVKSRLEMLMGSNIVRLTDRKYMLKLMSKIQQDYEAQQQIRIKERMKEELSRTKIMILNKLMPIQDAPEDIRKHSLFQLYVQCESIIQNTSKKETRKLTRLRKSLYRMLYPNATNSEKDELDKEENVHLKKITNGAETEIVSLTDEEISALLREEEEKSDMERGYILNQEDYDRLHYETEDVKGLRNAKSVEEMYAKAHAIVGILNSYADEARYKQGDYNDCNEKLLSETKNTLNSMENETK
ncbi:uncharacterized protein LOC122512565 [Leptopilina heterotoma]|uniref:uncharacterized protein LOC122512565 n=1 Tax=Leptopilina heterotoma TaxID=63436 RepID=UPI001CA92BCF|nr:uncharacterized protein LOC122512565 [Leptopilina heterotoma]